MCDLLIKPLLIFFAKIVQTESNTKQACLFLLPRCRLSYLKIVQTESNIKQAYLFLLPRCRLSLYKKQKKSPRCLRQNMELEAKKLAQGQSWGVWSDLPMKKSAT